MRCPVVPRRRGIGVTVGIEALLRGPVERGDLVGALALVAWGDRVEVTAAGLRDRASEAPMRRDTIFRIASMTKPVLAAAAMILVEEGRIGLDGSVEPWLPELGHARVLRSLESSLDDTVPANRAVTLRDLLTLRLGLGLIMAPPGTYPIQTAMADLGLAPGPDTIPFDPDAYMERVGRLPLAHQPGTRWMYHTGSDVLAVLIARVSGQPLAAFLRRRLFDPLGMADTGFHVPEDAIARLATAYARDDGAERPVVWDEARGGQYAAPPAFPSELVSTADDYLAFARMLLGHGEGPTGRVLARASVEAMLTDQITPEQKAASPFAPGFWDTRGWGFGLALVTRPDESGAGPGSYGWSGGIGTHILIDPAKTLVVLLITQQLMRGPDDAALAIAVFEAATSR